MRSSRWLLVAVLLTAATAFAKQNLTPTNYGEMEPAVFNHTEHAERQSCSDCHHNNGMEHRCGYCHQAEAQAGIPSMEAAAHAEGSGKCWTCHLKEKVKRALDCEGCHSG